MTENELREKVIKGLECCIAYDYKCNNCPYQDDGGAEDGCYSDELKANALALLKAKEPKTVQVIGNVGVSDVRFADCPWCAMRIHDDESRYYCGHCGKAVKWE